MDKIKLSFDLLWWGPAGVRGDFIWYVLFGCLKLEDLRDGSFVGGTFDAWGEFHFFLMVTGTDDPDSPTELEVDEGPTTLCQPCGKEDTEIKILLRGHTFKSKLIIQKMLVHVKSHMSFNWSLKFECTIR